MNIQAFRLHNRIKLLRYFEKLWSLNSKAGIMSRLELEFRAFINDAQRDHEDKRRRYKLVIFSFLFYAYSQINVIVVTKDKESTRSR